MHAHQWSCHTPSMASVTTSKFLPTPLPLFQLKITMGKILLDLQEEQVAVCLLNLK